MEYSGREFDVIVIGAGVMGSAAAYQLAKRGSRTLLLEQFDFLHLRGSSHGESRTIRASYSEYYYWPMVNESVQLWEEAEKEIGYKVYFKAQQFDMGPSEDKSILSIISSCKKYGANLEVLNAQEVASKFSGRFEIPENWAGVCTELGGVIKPTKAVAMFQTLAIQNGAILRDHKEVINIVKDEVNGGVTVKTKDGENFWGKKCVVTVGAWLEKLVKSVSGIKIPIQPLELMVCYWKIKEGYESQFAIHSDFPTFSSYGEPHIFGTPALEFPGLIKILVNDGYPCDPDKRGGSSQGVKMELLKEWIKEKFKGIVETTNGPVSTQLCMYSMTPDKDFVIDFLGGDEFGKDVVVGGGFSGHGFKMAPVVGRILADLALNEEAKGVELHHFRIKRFENTEGIIKDF